MDEIWKEAWGLLKGAGVAGAVLLILFWKFIPAMEKFREAVFHRLDKCDDVLDRFTRAQMIKLQASQTLPPDVKEAVVDLMKEVSDAQTARKAEPKA